MSDRDRTEISRIIGDMLNNPDESGIYPTSTCFTRLEHYINKVRTEAIGWCHAEVCITLDAGKDPRTTEVPVLLSNAQKDLTK